MAPELSDKLQEPRRRENRIFNLLSLPFSSGLKYVGPDPQTGAFGERNVVTIERTPDERHGWLHELRLRYNAALLHLDVMHTEKSYTIDARTFEVRERYA